MRICKTCLVEKELAEFVKGKNSHGGYTHKCKECTREYGRNYRKQFPEKTRETNSKNYEKHRDERKQRAREYYADNAEMIKAREREYYHSVKERYHAYFKEYRQQNSDKFVLYGQRRRARKLSVPDTLTRTDITEMSARFNSSCALSGKEGHIHLDHFIPIHLCIAGTTKENIIPLEKELNQSKGGSNPFEWIKTRNDIDKDKFLDVVFYLAEQNGLTTEEYEAHVYNCFD